MAHPKMMILVPTAGEVAAHEIASYVVDVAVRLNATLNVLHILQKGETDDGGERYMSAFTKAATGTELVIEPRVATGDVAQAIVDVAEEIEATLILMGASHGKFVEDWLSTDVMDKCEIPVLVVPHYYRG